MVNVDGFDLSNEDAEEYFKHKHLAAWADRLQYIYKIKLNSFYGGISNPFFRFFDARIGESTTGTGRMILRHQCRKVNELLGGEYNTLFPLSETVEEAIAAGNSPETALNGPLFQGKYPADPVIYGDSVTGDSIIQTLNGLQTIESLFKSVDNTDSLSDKQYHHPTSLCVRCYDEKDMSVVYRPVKYIMRHKTNKIIFRVTDNRGNFVDVTEDHSVLVVKRNIHHYWPLEEVKPQDLLSLDASYENWLVVVTPDSNEFTFNEVVSVSKIAYEGYVYDIEVEEFHNFFANNILVHNTDSTYFKTYADNKEEAIKVAEYVGKKVNESFPAFMREMFLCNDGFDNKVQSAREIVSNKGIFVDKKRYILNIVDKEGKAKNELKIMGLDVIKTTSPKHISKQLKTFMERYLNGESWDTIEKDIVKYKDELSKPSNIISIGLPKGVKKVEHYTGEYEKNGVDAKLPGHIAASIFYNIQRSLNNDNESPAIMSGMKIKVFYLKQKKGKFKSIALPGDLTTPPEWFYQFDVDIDAHIERLIDNPINNIIKAINKQCPSHQSLFINDMLVIE